MSDEIVTFADITRDQFKIYCDIQHSGKTNMHHLSQVEQLSEYELDRDTIRCIINNYAALVGKFGAM